MIPKTWYQNWMIVVLLFLMISVVHFIAAFHKSIPLNLVGLALYALAIFALVNKKSWGDIGIRKINSWQYIIQGVFWGIVFVTVSSLLLDFLVGYSTANYLVVIAKQQLSYGMITKQNAWQYFPIAVIGFCSLSPITEELFFRGLMMKALEIRFSSRMSNVVQGLLYGLIHLAYIWLTAFNEKLIVTMVPVIMVAGCLYGWVAQRTRSVFSSMIVHSEVNCLLLLWVYSFVIPVLEYQV